jgi:hypothetical protein
VSVPHMQWLYILGNIGYIILLRRYCHSLSDNHTCKFITIGMHDQDIYACTSSR